MKRVQSTEHRAQGTIEYLIIIAIVVVISLVVVGILTGFLGTAPVVGEQSSQLSNWSNSLAITETSVNPDGNYLVRLANNSSDLITISNVRVGDTNNNFSEDLAMGGAQNFVVSSNDFCSEGTNSTQQVIVTYYSKYGLRKTEIYPAKAFFACENYSVNLSATRCPASTGISVSDTNATASQVLSTYYFYNSSGTGTFGSMTGGGGGATLHSGQITVYDSDCDDATNDGTAKSYTDNNGDGTVTDNQTGLMWAKDHYNNCETMTWATAIDTCEALATGSGGLTDGSSAGDWRVPSFVELATLPDMNYPFFSYLNRVFTQTGWDSDCWGYWSSTTVPSGTSNAYYLNSINGYVNVVNKANGALGVRCVRSE